MSQELSRIADDMEALLPLFVEGPSLGLFLQSQHAARFKMLAIEAKELVREALGPMNDYTLGLMQAEARDIGGFTDGPSHSHIEECVAILRAAARSAARKALKRQPSSLSGREDYVAASRINEISALPSKQWDFRRLIEMCREINVASANQCNMSTVFLLRSIINHVPPIFGLKEFAHVASQYPFAASVKKAMQRLQAQGRDSADFHLHQPIRKHETLPSEAQVAYRQDLDVLLGEVIRVTRETGTP